MKKAIITTKKMSVLLISIFILGLTQKLGAQDNKESKPVDLKFAGKFADYPVFQLNLNNTEPDEFRITIKDDKSNVLYLGWVKGTNAVQRYRLEMDDEELRNLVLEITSKKTKQYLVYHINKTSRTIEEILVAKL